MDVKTAIKERRSVRKYQDQPIPEDTILEIIDSARLAPSGNNSQPWRYKLITSDEEKELLKENNIFKQDFVYTAPLIIICCADPEIYPKTEFEEGLDDSNEKRAFRDLGISSQNLVLRCTELGLGTCYVGWVDKPKIKKVLDLPERYVVPYVITVGYPAEPTPEHKKKDIKEILI